MALRRLITAFSMTAREVLRNRIVLLLFFIIPTVFLGLTVVTTRKSPMIFRLAALQDEPTILVTQRHVGIVFIGLTTVALLAGFVSMYLMQKDRRAVRRLALCNFPLSTMVLARLLLMLTLLFAISLSIDGLSRVFLRPSHPVLLLLSYLLTGYVYGAYGLLVGTLFLGELEGILCVVLLVNIDIGWLQNPLYYEAAQSKLIIRLLPAFYPSQAGMITAFTDFSPLVPFVKSFLYGSLFLLLAVFIFQRRNRIYQDGQ